MKRLETGAGLDQQLTPLAAATIRGCSAYPALVPIHATVSRL